MKQIHTDLYEADIYTYTDNLKVQDLINYLSGNYNQENHTYFSLKIITLHFFSEYLLM